MIPIEKAKDITLQTKGDMFKVNHQIDEIYNSVGRCSTCCHMGELGIFCIKNQKKVPKDGYCHEHKEEII